MARTPADMLYHVSEDPGIRRFEPRPSANAPEPVVWAIDAAHLRNYLLPRDCPRVTFSAAAHTTDADRVRFLGAAPSVVAIEERWLGRVHAATLTCYHLPAEQFRLLDASAGYFVSQTPATPVDVETVRDPARRLLTLGVELRVLPNLWVLHDAVAASTLEFSMIRMANAAPRP